MKSITFKKSMMCVLLLYIDFNVVTLTGMAIFTCIKNTPREFFFSVHLAIAKHATDKDVLFILYCAQLYPPSRTRGINPHQSDAVA